MFRPSSAIFFSMTIFSRRYAASHGEVWSYLDTNLPVPSSDMAIAILPTGESKKIVITGGCDDPKGNIYVEDPDYGEYFTCMSLTDKVYGFTPTKAAGDEGKWGGSFEELASMPRKRARHGNAIIGGDQLCLFGGRDDMDVLIAEIDCYDPTSNTWSTPASLPESYLTSDSAAVAINDSTVYLIGGYEADYVALDQVVIIDMSDMASVQFSSGPSLLTERGDVDVVVLGSDVYVSGGFTHENDYSAPHATVEKLDISSTTPAWINVDALNEERGDKQLVDVNGKIYALGGETKVDTSGYTKDELPLVSLADKSIVLDTVEVFDPAGGANAQWKSLSDMPVTLFRFTATEWEEEDDHVIFVLGGQVGYNPDCECFATTDKVLVFDVDHAEEHVEDVGPSTEETANAGLMLGGAGAVGHMVSFLVSSMAWFWCAL